MNLKSEAQPVLVRRREFLVWSAVGAMVPWVEGIARAAQSPPIRSIAFQAAKRVEPMSIGYVDGSYAFQRLDILPWSPGGVQKLSSEAPLAVLSAAEMAVGDQRFAGHASARLLVHGLYPSAPAACRGIDSVDLDINFPSPDPASSEPLPFYAWTFRRRPGLNVSPPVEFSVPLGVDGQLDISLRTVYRGEGSGLALRGLTASPFVEHRFRASFTVDGQQGVPKLQRGIYLLGLRPGVWDGGTRLPGAKDGARASDLCSVAVSVEPVAEG